MLADRTAVRPRTLTGEGPAAFDTGASISAGVHGTGVCVREQVVVELEVAAAGVLNTVSLVCVSPGLYIKCPSGEHEVVSSRVLIPHFNVKVCPLAAVVLPVQPRVPVWVLVATDFVGDFRIALSVFLDGGYLDVGIWPVEPSIRVREISGVFDVDPELTSLWCVAFVHVTYRHLLGVILGLLIPSICHSLFID